MSSYEEALAKQRGVASNKDIIEHRKKLKRKLIGVPIRVKSDLPQGMVMMLMRHKGGFIPCCHIYIGEEHGDLLAAQIAIIGPDSLPRMEAANDSQA